MWGNAPFGILMHMRMGYLMHVGNQESLGAQIGVDRNLRLSVGQYPEIAQAGSAGAAYVKNKLVGLPERLAVGGCCRWYNQVEWSCQDAKNAKKPYKHKAFSREDRCSDAYFALSVTVVAESVTVIVVAESGAMAAVSVDMVVVVVSVVVVSSVFGLFWQAAKVSVLPTNRRAITFFMIFSGGIFKFRGKYSFF